MQSFLKDDTKPFNQMLKISTTLLYIFFLYIASANAQTADFLISGNGALNCTPATITFTQNCTGTPVGYSWNFGNGQTATSASATIVYNSPGTYTVKLTAIYSNSSVTVSKSVVISQGIKRVITADNSYICSPGNIRFGSTGTGNIASYQWNFGDGTAVVNTTSDTITHNFSTLGKFTVKLTATDVSGCTADTSLLVAVQRPPITATISRATACVPATSVFSATVTVPANATVTSYEWLFGDGSPSQITTANTVNHVYSLTGTYPASVNIVTSNGCTASYNLQTLSYGTPPGVTTAYATKPSVCASEAAVLVAKSANANRYFWGFGDGATLSVNDTITSHKYTAPGTKSVGVTPYNNGCQGAFTRVSVVVKGVIAKYDFKNSCTSKNSFGFSDSSLGNVTSRTWNFGDASPTSNAVNPVHAYAAGSKFSPSLIVNDAVSGCADTISKTLYTPVTTFSTAASSVCKNSPVTFTVSSTYTDSSIRYNWRLLGNSYGPDSVPTKKVFAVATGNYNNFVVINRGPQFCPDTLLAPAVFSVTGPVAGFTADSISCTKNKIVLKNTSYPFNAADAISFWNWDKGNNAPGDVSFEPAPYLYDSTGTYRIGLTAIDKNGCTDTLSKLITINHSPAVAVLPKADTICAGAAVRLVATSSDPITWSPATALSCSTCNTVIATPLVTTTYYAIATNAANCSIQDSVFIKVNSQSTGTATGGDTTICSGQAITLDANPKGQKIVWSPSTYLSDSTIYTPVATPLQTIVYNATIIDSAACSVQNAVYSVTVNTSPTADAGPDKFYNKGTSFSIAPVYSSNVTSYAWSPAVSLSCTDCASPSGIASNTQQYLLKVAANNGCTATDTIVIYTNCLIADIHLPTAFTPGNDNLNEVFYPLTGSYTNIISFTIFNRAGQIIYGAKNFPGNDRSFGWNGKWKGANQPQGTYIYLLEATCENNRRVILKGSVLLLR